MSWIRGLRERDRRGFSNDGEGRLKSKRQLTAQQANASWTLNSLFGQVTQYNIGVWLTETVASFSSDFIADVIFQSAR